MMNMTAKYGRSVGMALLLAGLAISVAMASLPLAQAAEPVRVFERHSLKAIESEQAGQAFWLVLWDLECSYCMVSMKNLAAVQKKNPSMRIITVATDGIDARDPLQARLAGIGLRGQAYAFGAESTEALRYAIDPKWRGEKPRAYYYAPDGQRRMLSGVLTAERIAGH